MKNETTKPPPKNHVASPVAPIKRTSSAPIKRTSSYC